MMARGSLVRQVVLSLLMVTILLGLVATGAGLATINRELNESMDAAMRQVARRLLPLVVDDLFRQDAPETAIRLPDSLSDEDGEPLVYQVRDGSGRVLLRSHDAPEAPLTATLEEGFAQTKGWRVYTEPSVNDSIFVQVAEANETREEETLEAALGFLLPIAALTPLVAWFAWRVLVRALRPVEDLRGEIDERRGDHLEPIETAGLPVELSSIAGSVNALLARLNTAIEAEREFTANAAHELRTPLAGALAQADRLISEAGDDAARHRGRQVKAALNHLARLSEKLLQLARADAGTAVNGAPVEIGGLAALVIADIERQQNARGCIVLRRGHGPAMVGVDPDAFSILLRNLLENALLHGERGGTLEVTVLPDRLTVANDGPVVAPERLSKLTRRFERGGAEVEGTGLGLAIVERIAGQLGGRLDLVSPRTGHDGGFEARVSFTAE